MKKLIDLYSSKTLDELLKIQNEIYSEPTNRHPTSSFWIYKKSAQEKLDAIGWAISYHLKEKKRTKNGS